MTVPPEGVAAGRGVALNRAAFPVGETEEELEAGAVGIHKANLSPFLAALGRDERHG